MDLRGLRIAADESAIQEWAGEITKVLAQFHLDSRIGLAATPDLALLAARKSSLRNGLLSSEGGEGDPITIVSDPAEFVSVLPIEMLGLPAETLETLNHWGIGAAGALLALGKDQLTERLGPAVIDIFERLSPASIRPLKIASLPETFAEQIEFQNEIETLEPLLFVLRQFIEQLSRRIELLYLVVAELHLKLGLSSGAAYESVK